MTGHMEVFHIYYISGVFFCLLICEVIFLVFYFRYSVYIRPGSLSFVHSAVWASTCPALGSHWRFQDEYKHSPVWETDIWTDTLQFCVKSSHLTVESWLREILDIIYIVQMRKQKSRPKAAGTGRAQCAGSWAGARNSPPGPSLNLGLLVCQWRP